MSRNRPTDARHDRRQWLKSSATLLGASLLPIPPVASEMLQGDSRAEISKEKLGGNSSAEPFLTPAQHFLLAELTETIIPADEHSGGAKAAKVADYVEQTIRERADETRQSEFKEGLRLVDLMSRHYCGKSFVDASAEEKIAVLTVLFDNRDKTELPEVRFFRDLRQLTVEGYYTSRIGIHDDLDYKGNVALMEYVGCDDHSEDTS